MYICIDPYTHTHTHTHTHIYMYIYKYTYAHICTHNYLQIIMGIRAPRKNRQRFL